MTDSFLFDAGTGEPPLPGAPVVTEVKVRLIPDPPSRAVAFVTLVFSNGLVIRDILLLHGDRENPDRYFLQFPRRGLTRCQSCSAMVDAHPHNGRIEDVAHPINQTVRNRITAVVVEQYLKTLANASKALNYGYGRYETHSLQAATCSS